jgi:hypothetical protein
LDNAAVSFLIISVSQRFRRTAEGRPMIEAEKYRSRRKSDLGGGSFPGVVGSFSVAMPRAHRQRIVVEHQVCVDRVG